MNASQRDTLRRMAENFRTRAGAIEVQCARTTWVQSINVIEAFNQCAEDLETFLNATLEARPQEQAPTQAALCAPAEVQTTNPS